MFLFVVFIFGFFAQSFAALPPFLKQCKSTDSQCVKTQMTNSLLALAEGSKALKIFKLDPMMINEFVIKAAAGPISLAQRYSNVSFAGLSNMDIAKFTFDLDKCNIYAGAVIKTMHSEGHYKLKGNILLIPIDGEGEMVVDSDNIDATFTMNCEKYDKEGTQYLKIKDVKVRLVFNEVRFQLAGEVVKGNEQINQQVQKLLNENSKAFAKQATPDLEALIEDIIKDVGDKIFSHASVKELFSDQ